MSQTHLSLHYHIVFHTKDNRPAINAEWRDRLHSFLGGCTKTAGGIPIAIGGTADHVHLLIGLRATHRLADFVKDIKVADHLCADSVVESGLLQLVCLPRTRTPKAFRKLARCGASGLVMRYRPARHRRAAPAGTTRHTFGVRTILSVPAPTLRIGLISLAASRPFYRHHVAASRSFCSVSLRR